MKLHNRSTAPPRVEMLPLIDIVFLLLVVFIYAMAVHRGQQVDLPESATAGLETAESVSVTIQNRHGVLNFFVDEKPVDLPQLEEMLRDKKKEGKENGPDVQIFAEKSVSYQDLYHVLDRVRMAGLTSISLQAQLEPAATP